MKAKIFTLIVLILGSQIGQAMACAVCYGAKGSKANEHLAIAIWVMLGAIMSVLGGVGAFGVHLWRHSSMPLEPHQELTQENFDQYD